jgi:EmrB/QacA subfamily drug resistance transporter
MTEAFVDKQTERWVLVATILAASMAFINSTSLNLALPALQRGLGVEGEQILWVINGYTLMLAAFILLGGTLGDRYGRKRIYIIGITVFMVGSLLCGISPTPNFLIGARVVQGAGGALMVPGSLAIITALVPPDRRGAAIGTWSGATTVVTLVGPLLGGALAQADLWRWIFLINVPLAIAALVVLVRQVPENRDEDAAAQIDYLGAMLAAIGLAGLTFGFTQARDAGFTDPLVVGTVVGGAVALGLFIVVEARADNPMLPLWLFKSKTFTGANLLTLFLYGALYANGVFLSLNLIQVQGYPEILAALLGSLPSSVMLALLSRWAGGLVDRIGPRIPLSVGPIVAGLGLGWLATIGLTAGPSEYITTFFPGLLLFGLGMGVTVAPLTTTVMSALDTNMAGRASAVNNAVSRTGGALAVAIIGAVVLIGFTNRLEVRTADLPLSSEAEEALQTEARNLAAAETPPQVAADYEENVQQAIELAYVDVYRVAMLICAGLAFLSAGATLVLIRPEQEPPPEPPPM